ncbi:MAG TPA: hypothetical protein VMP01_02025 [Pirellulaceae bacterium]|nr:hypothetical protein [Pirellulaceae bacterium]
MSTPPPTRPAAHADPLRAFRDRAAVILAEERGFSPQSRVKLAQVARELGLSDAEAEEAIRSLKDGARPKATDPIVEKFRQRLHKDLAGRHRTVIGPEIEARVVESAKRKYGLDEPTVREVLAEVAVELGMRHITGDQAVQLYVDMVDEAVGDATWLSREAWDRLRSAGEKWGLSFEEADELIEEKLAASRRAAASGRLMNRLILAGSLSAVALVVATLVVVYHNNRSRSEKVAADGSTETATSVLPETKTPPAQPAWWDVDLAVSMATARREVKDVAGLYDDLRSGDAAIRKQAYAQLVSLALKIDADRPERQTVIDLMAGCHALDPDEVCAGELRQGLLSLIPGGGQELTRSSAIYQRAYFAAETALALLARQGMPAARAEALAAATSAAVGVRVAPTDALDPQSLRTTHAALTKTLYRHLTSRGPGQPQEAAGLQVFLTTQGSLWLTPEELERLNTAFLVAMLTGAEQAWKTFEPLMESLCSSRDPVVVLELLNVYRRAENAALQKALGALLVRRAGARPRSDDPRQVARAVRQALGAAGVPIAQSAEDRWDELKAAVEPVLGRAPASLADRGATMAETVELAELATQALALAQGEPGFAIFDELVREEEPVTVEKAEPEESAPGDSGAVPGPRLAPLRKRPLSPSERQSLGRAIGQLADFENQAPVVRVNALRIVAARVPLAGDITYDQATIVARYLLAKKGDEEVEAMLESLSPLRSWRQVRLAVADHLSQSQLTPGQRSQILSPLSGGQIIADETPEPQLRQLLLRELLADLESLKGHAVAASAGPVTTVDALAEAYRQRARVLAVPAAEYLGTESPAAALEVVVRAAGRRMEESWTHNLRVAEYLGDHEAHRTVLLQRLLLETLVQRTKAMRPKQAADAEKILTELSAADAAAGDLLAQLRSGERATLKMGMLYAVP